jgi:heat shock protein HslJ
VNRAARGLPFAVAVALGLTACSLVEDVPDQQAERVYGRTWIAEEVSGQPVPGGIEPSLVVAPDGKVSGHAGCNGYFGSVIISGEAMSFGNLGSTRKACAEPAMTQESKLMHALDSTRGYRMQDGELVLLDGAGAALVRFRDEETGV